MRFPILIYHRISPNPADGSKYIISNHLLERHIDYFRRKHYFCLTADQIPFDPNTAEDPSRPRVMLSFDDGHDDNYTLAYRVLHDLQVAATFFVITGRIGLPGYLSWQQLREMHRGGMCIQSHTVSHRFLSSLSHEEIRNELQKSKDDIEQHLSTPVRCLSLPFGDAPRYIMDDAFAAGYKVVFTSRVDYARGNSRMLPRINIHGRVSDEEFERIVQQTPGVLLRRRGMQMAKGTIKRALLWCGIPPRESGC